MTFFKQGDLVEIIDPKLNNFDLSSIITGYAWIKEMNNSIGGMFEIEKIIDKNPKVYYKLSNGWFYPEQLLVIVSNFAYCVGEKVVVYRKHEFKENNKYPWHERMDIYDDFEVCITRTEANHSFLEEMNQWYHNNVLELVDSDLDDCFPDDIDDTDDINEPDDTNIIITSPCKT